MLNVPELIGHVDLLFITLDSLRYDVATRALESGLTPNLARLLPQGQWELRHTPATFTFAAHQAFFAGFLPTPAAPGHHARLFASSFKGSKTTSSRSFVYPEATWVEALAARGYHTVCIGGTGFFNLRGALGSRLPALFEHAYWWPVFGVDSPKSTEAQVNRALRLMRELAHEDRLLLFVNVSATHTPTRIFAPGAKGDNPDTQLAALEYADGHLGRLLDAFQARGDTLCIVCSDHGDAFGEDGYEGHRLAHEVVWNVPYTEYLLKAEDER